jgi:hypothetical protein
LDLSSTISTIPYISLPFASKTYNLYVSEIIAHNMSFDLSDIIGNITISPAGLLARTDTFTFVSITLYADLIAPESPENQIILPNTNDFVANSSIRVNITAIDDGSAISSVVIQSNVLGLLPMSRVGSTNEYELIITDALMSTLDPTLYQTIDLLSTLIVTDNFGNVNTTIITDGMIILTDVTAPELNGILINGEKIDLDSNTIDIDPNTFVMIEVLTGDGGNLGSGIFTVTVYYTLENPTGDYTTWNSFDLDAVDGRYYNTFPNDQLALVGFPQGSTITFVIVIEDRNDNVLETDQITMTVGEEGSEWLLPSQILMAIAGAIVVGSIIYRFLRRKKVKVIDRG